MRKHFLYVTLAFIIAGGLGSQQANGQGQNDLVNFLQAGKDDASKLMNAYLNPVIEGLSYGMNGGWYNTAKAHKTLGFDFGVSFNGVFIPSDQNYFDPNKLGLKDAKFVSSTASNGLAPTLVGPDNKTTYSITDPVSKSTVNFDGPQGLDFQGKVKISGVLAPTAQVGIGIFKSTDLKIRYMPEVSSGSTKVKLIGFGLMHDIKQYIPDIKLLPFDLSILAAFTKVNGTSGLAGMFDPSASDTRPQKVDYEMNAWLIQALISKKFSVVTFYGGIGYNSISTTSHVTGSYVIFPDPSGQGNEVALTDPVNLSFKNNSFRLSGGIRFKFGPFYLNGDYTLQQYKTASVGLGFSFR